jgi:hypothetical protein
MAKGTRIYLVVFSDVLPLVKGSRVKTFEVPGSTFEVRGSQLKRFDVRRSMKECPDSG